MGIELTGGNAIRAYLPWYPVQGTIKFIVACEMYNTVIMPEK
jgi:hypothetical protein